MIEAVSHNELSIASQPVPQLGNSIAQPPAEVGVAVSREKRTLKFVKDWGGVATVSIALLYTFPFDAAGKFINWREQNLINARKAIFDVSALYAAGTAAVASVQDPQARNFLSNTYNIRIFNTLKQNEAAIEGAKKQLLSSELYMVGSLYSLSGLPEAFAFYKLALDQAKTNDEKVTIYREIGNARFTIGPNQNVDEARSSYVNALRLASKIPYLQMLYDQDLAELGGFELMNGDWTCGKALASYAVSLLDIAVQSPIAPQQLRDVDSIVHGYLTTYQQPRPDQPSKGCPYTVPTIDASTVSTMQTAPTSQGPVSTQPQMVAPSQPRSIPPSR